MTNRLLGLLAASLLVVSACGGDTDSLEGADEALDSQFDTAEHRASGAEGRGDARGRGDCARGPRRMRMEGAGGGDGARGRGAHEGADDGDRDADESTDESAGGDGRAGEGRGRDGAAQGDRCRGGDDDRAGTGGQARDGGVRPTRPTPSGQDGGVIRGPRDASVTPPIPRNPDPSGPVAGPDTGAPGSGETVTLPDGSTVRIDATCPSLTRSGITLPGCCLPANTCGLSTHLIDVTGVPKGCQTYEQGRMVDPTFDFADKACTFRN